MTLRLLTSIICFWIVSQTLAQKDSLNSNWHINTVEVDLCVMSMPFPRETEMLSSLSKSPVERKPNTDGYKFSGGSSLIPINVNFTYRKCKKEKSCHLLKLGVFGGITNVSHAYFSLPLEQLKNYYLLQLKKPTLGFSAEYRLQYNRKKHIGYLGIGSLMAGTFSNTLLVGSRYEIDTLVTESGFAYNVGSSVIFGIYVPFRI